MTHQGRACLLLWDVDTLVEMRTTRCYKFIHVSVIPMLLGDIGRKASGTFAQHRPHMAMSQSDFRSAVLCGVVTEQQYNFFREYRYPLQEILRILPSRLAQTGHPFPRKMGNSYD